MTMNPILELVRHPAASRWGEVLLHFLWQGTAVAALLAVALARLRQATAATRYQLACAAMGLMAVLPVATWLVLDGSDWLPSVAGRSGSGTMAATPSGMAPGMAPGAYNLPWRGAVLLVWIFGAAGFGVRLIGGWWQARRLTERNVVPLGEPWAGRLRELARRLEVSRPVRLLESGVISAPLVLGWLRPVILVPVGMMASLSPGEVDAILAHELAHLRRHDYLVNLGQRVIEALLFYHPAVWWVSGRIRAERENCCDDLAAQAVGDGRVVARALVALAERNAGIPALALAADGGALGERVRRLLGAKSAGGRTGIGRRLLQAAGVGLLTLGGIWAFSQAMSPKLFVATARLRLDVPSVAVEPGKAGGYDPYFIQTEFEVIRSKAVLHQVVERFVLTQAWSGNGPTLSVPEAVSRLRERVRVTQFRNTALVEVQVADTEADRAAELANGVVETYRQHRQDRHIGRATPKYRMLEQEAEAQGQQANNLREELLKVQAEMKQAGEKVQRVGAERELEIKRRVERAESLHEIVRAKLKEFDLATKSSLSEIEVIDLAEPPVKARRWRLVRD